MHISRYEYDFTSHHGVQGRALLSIRDLCGPLACLTCASSRRRISATSCWPVAFSRPSLPHACVSKLTKSAPSWRSRAKSKSTRYAAGQMVDSVCSGLRQKARAGCLEHVRLSPGRSGLL